MFVTLKGATTFRIATFSVMTLSVTIFGEMTLGTISIMAFNMTTLRKMTLSHPAYRNQRYYDVHSA
jgi:hypothetical protein